MKHWKLFKTGLSITDSLRSTVLYHISIQVALLLNNLLNNLTTYPTNKLQIFISSRTSKHFAIIPKSVLSHTAPHHAPLALTIQMNYLLFPKGPGALFMLFSISDMSSSVISYFSRPSHLQWFIQETIRLSHRTM